MSTDPGAPSAEADDDAAPQGTGRERPGESHDSNAGAPVNPAVKQPTDEELDQRDRDKARPRRAAGPPLRDDSRDGAPRDAPSHEPPPATEPRAAGSSSGDVYAPAPPPIADAGAGSTHTGSAGQPADYAGPKPSDDDLDRRDRMKAGPRRAAGPPLRDDAPPGAPRDELLHQPPPPTDPEQ